jgi:cell division inhibitor SepF
VGERRFSVTNTGAFKLVLIEPKSFDECPKLVDSLKSHKPIIINLERLDTAEARKIFDFLNGATYALNGNVQKIANNIFVFAPENVDIAGGQRMSGQSRFDYTNGGETAPAEPTDPVTDPDNPWK